MEEEKMEESKSQRIMTSSARQGPLDITGKPHPRNLNRIVAQTKFK